MVLHRHGELRLASAGSQGLAQGKGHGMAVDGAGVHRIAVLPAAFADLHLTGSPVELGVALLVLDGRVLAVVVAQPLGAPLAPAQARLLAYVRASVAGTPQAIESAVAAYAGSCTIVETTADAVLASRSPVTEDTIRGVFRFAVVVPVIYAKSDAQVARISAIVNRMKPAHTSFSVVNAVGFYCDDSTTPSWTDTTALGT